jgi:hypothetical protein
MANTTLRINRHLFTETGTDSASLNVLGTLVHRFPDEGDYVIEVSRDGQLLGSHLLVVSDEYHAVQADFDLSTFGGPTTGIGDDDCDCHGPCTCEAQAYTCVREDGYAVFYVGRGPGGYTVTVDPVGERREAREFDSRKLGEDDTFAAVLLRPGTYAVRNPVADAETRLVVTYPDPEKGSAAVRQPVTVECAEGGFEHEREVLEIHPGQGLVFDIGTPSRVVVELREPDERATEGGGPGRVRMVNPNRSALSGRRRVRPRVDPTERSVEELESDLASVTNVGEVRAVLATERRGENRSTAVEAIGRRLRELERERERRREE